ncbi:hypothetical protein C0J52_06521 [Blattella germanica]|nr:hypothetical protein C0J52_06521 [Blattella germanica]
MAYERVHLLPLAIFVIFPCTFLGTYIAAVLLGHVEPDFPYISDAATYSPESCVFGQLMNSGTVLLVMVVYIRYRQIDECYRSYALPVSIVKHNKISMWFGFVSCFGLSLVANFQETNVIIVHLTGAFLCFGLGTVYIWLQAICSYYLHPLVNTIFMAHLRVALAMLCTVFFILLSITGVISHLQFNDGGWEMHVVSTVSEWIVATSFCVFILTFVREFRTIAIEEPQFLLTVERMGTASANSESSPIIASSTSADEVNVIVRQEEIPVNEEDKILGSDSESQSGQNNHDDTNRGNEQLPRSVVIIASTSSSSTSVRSSTPPHASAAQQSSELVPSKLLSLSLSLLVAAFFQAIRCLTEFIEDTFRTIHCELDME